MQTILTKFIPASNTRGSRIKAVQSGWNDKSVTINYPYELDQESAHAEAAKKLAEKLGWSCEYIQGSLGARFEYAYVFTPTSDTRWEF